MRENAVGTPGATLRIRRAGRVVTVGAALGVAGQTRRWLRPMFRKTTPPTMASTENSWAPPGLIAPRLLTVTLQSVLLICGLISSVLYIATDIAGGLSYPGYSFTSQAISELMAIEGVEIVGPVPEAINTRAVFSAALFHGADPRAAAWLGWLAAALTPERLRAGGLEPA